MRAAIQRGMVPVSPTGSQPRILVPLNTLLLPLNTYLKLPLNMFTAASKYDSFTARLHFMVGNLSCFDVRLSTADKKDLLQLVLQRQRLHPARAPAAALWSLTLSYVLRGHDGLISVGRSLALRTMTKLMTSCRSECICDWDYLPVFDPVNS